MGRLLHERYTAYWIGWLGQDIKSLRMPEETRRKLLATIERIKQAQKNEIADGVLSYSRSHLEERTEAK
jgi:hypothetical protein